MLLDAQRYPEGNGVGYGPGNTYGHFGVNFPMHISKAEFLGFPNKTLMTLAFSDPGLLM